MTDTAILCIDDSSTTRKLVSYALTQRGHKVMEAPDGATGLALMAEHRPSLVLLDLVLPDTDGFALVSPLRDRAGEADTTIIAFSGFITNLDEARLAAAGFDDVIGKPIDPDRLVALIEARLSNGMAMADDFGAKKTVVVADDDPLQLKLLRIGMEQHGFEVVTARDGAEALERARACSPDAIVADVMMPRLDGFELAVAIRQEPELRDLPVLLVTSSYTEDADRRLAKASGATDLVIRTPNLTEVLRALRETLERPAPVTSMPVSSLERERMCRVVNQLERQVALNSGLAQRNSTLSAELAVLTRVSELVLENQSLETALDEALTACFDAGGISVGALYLLGENDEISVRTLQSESDWGIEDLTSFFGHEDVLRRCIAAGAPQHIPSPVSPLGVTEDLLAKCGAHGVLVIPLSYLGQAQGALVMFSRRRELYRPEWMTFSQAIANQISQVLALGAAFEERKRAEQVAIERTAFLDALLEQAPDVVLYLDPDAIVQYASRSVVLPKGVDGGDVTDLCVGSVAERFRGRLEEVLGSGESASWEETYRGRGRTEVSFWWKMGPVRQHDEVTGVVILARDISEKKATDARMVVADRMASVGMIAAGVAHEINNPMQSLVVNVDLVLAELKQLAKRAGVSPDIIEALEDARDAGTRIRTIVRDLRVFSRVEKETREPVNVGRLLDSTLRIARNELRERARVRTDYANIPAAYGSEARLGQVFLNLIINAAHAIPPGHGDENTIEISAKVVDEQLVVSVADSGTGIPEELQDQVFMPFFTTKPAGVGTGLGLSICHRIVLSLGGELTFESRPGRTVFRVTLPLAPEDETPLPSPMKAPSATKRCRVLVVDDEALVRKSVERSLGRSHEVVTASSAVEALALLRKGPRFNVALCDLMMPSMNGRELFEQMKVLDAELAARTIFVTGGSFTRWVSAFLETVPNHRLEKPFDVEVLRVVVDSLVS